MAGRFPISDEGKLRGKGGEVETLTPHISPEGGPGAPKFFLVVGHEVACLNSKHGVPPVRGRGRGIFQSNFAKKLGGKRCQRVWETCNSYKISVRSFGY